MQNINNMMFNLQDLVWGEKQKHAICFFKTAFYAISIGISIINTLQKTQNEYWWAVKGTWSSEKLVQIQMNESDAGAARSCGG